MIKSFLFLVMFVVVSSASDTVTIGGLQWQDDSASRTVKRSYSGAISYCEALSLSGYSDWRLPSIKELQSIVDIGRYKPAIKSSFKNIASKFYWSCSPFASASKHVAWGVSFRGGNTSNGSSESYVRCVRSRQ
jgi:hypothetical protein